MEQNLNYLENIRNPNIRQNHIKINNNDNSPEPLVADERPNEYDFMDRKTKVDLLNQKFRNLGIQEGQSR